MKISMKSLLVIPGIIVFILISVLLEVDPMLSLAIMLWMLLFWYGFENIKKRSMLVAFLISFFVFLLGRDISQQYFDYQREFFDVDTQFHAFLSYVLSLLTIGICYPVFEKKETNKQVLLENLQQDDLIKKLSLRLYIVSWLFAVASKVMVGLFVAERGFTDYYTDYSVYLSGNLPLYIMSKIELMMPASWAIYLATLPTKAEMKKPLYMYLFYMLVSLGTGQRSVAILGGLFLFIYFMFRDGIQSPDRWINKRMIGGGLLSLPFVAFFVSFYNIWREKGNLEELSFTQGIVEFFYNQGVTTNVVKRAFMNADFIPPQIYTLEFLHSGIFAFILDIHVYHGNTIDHALYGGSFTHALGYVVMGAAYLAGRGTGSSYIAELFYDFDYIGVILGNVLYAYFLARMISFSTKDTVFYRSIRFMIITELLWAPRGSFTGFISQNLIPTTMVAVALTFGVAKLWRMRNKAGAHRLGDKSE